jgi:RNA polymerase subunit RPABC4/transcription elongation factor Spt4
MPMSEILSVLPLAAGSVWEKVALVAAILLIAYVITLWISTVMWTYRDIQARTSDRSVHAICAFLVAVFNIPGLALYLMLRPQQTLSDRFDRQLEVEAFMHDMRDKPSCPSCRRSVDEAFLACPYCRTTLRSACEDCGTALDRNWVICPYCMTDRGAAREPERRPATPAAAQSRGRQWRQNVQPKPSTALSTSASGSLPPGR